jgi:hypothetical protein
MKTQIRGYFAVYDRKSQKLCGMDTASGGYLYITSDFRDVKLFFDEYEAKKWAAHWENDNNYDLIIKSIEIKVGGLV